MIKVLSIFADIVAIVAIGFSIGAWFYSRRVDNRIKAELSKQEERIDIRLSDGTREIFVGSPRRKWLTRPELNGLLGLLPMRPVKKKSGEIEKQPRYSFSSIDWNAVAKQTEGAQDGKLSQFIIQCNANELDQFKQEVIKPVGV